MKVRLSSDLLVPMPEYAGKDMRKVCKLTGQNRDDSVFETVEIWAVNAENREGIIAVCNNIVAGLEKELEANPDEGAEKQLNSFKGFVQKIGTAFEHEVPEELLCIVSREAGKALLARDAIYISGVSYME